MEIKLTITWSQESNQIRVEGPIQDKMLCYGMLKSAEHIVHDHQQSPIVVPTLKMVGRNDKSN